MRIWTEEAKAAQREAIKKWQPWSRSTGPRTAAGKTRVSANARKSDRMSVKSMKILRAALAAQSRCRRAFEQYDFLKNQEKSEKQTIMRVYLHSLIATSNRDFLQGMINWYGLEQAERCPGALSTLPVQLAEP